MDKASRVRWMILTTGFAATLVAIFYPDDEGAGSADRPHAQHRAQVSAALAPLPASDDMVESPQGDPDPFAPRGWQPPPPPPPPEPPKAAPAIAPAEPAAPTGPPPLPFRFVGSMTDGAEQIVYLGRGDQAIVAHVGDVLENTYKVVSINAGQIELEYIPLGQKQALVFPTRDN